MNQQPTAPWSAKQERLALLVATGRPIKAAAAECKVGERTAHTWLADAAYRALVSELRARLLNEALGKLADGAGAAAGELRALLRDPNSTVRLRAAIGLLDTFLKVREHVDLADRVSTLEGLAADAQLERAVDRA